MNNYVKQTLVPGWLGPLKMYCARYIHVLISAMLISVGSEWAAISELLFHHKNNYHAKDF